MTHAWSFPPLDAFRAAPTDHTVFVTDVEGSTRRITGTGSYRDVTFLATAGLVAAENGAGPVPGVFTGDGCLVLATPAQAPAVAAALAAVAGWARANLGLGLRVAGIPVAALGAPLQVANHRLGSAEQWHFLGGGATAADTLAKQAERFRLSPDTAASPDLTGLSCRWDPVRTGRGLLVSILVQACGTDAADSHRSLSDLYAQIALAAAPNDRLWPVRDETLRFAWPPGGLALEAAALVPRPGLRRRLAHLRLLVQTAGAAVLIRSGVPAARAYVAGIGRNAVAAQVIDGLALIIDCTEAHHTAIRAVLEQARLDGRILYGTWASEQAYMSCVVRGLDDHRHFLDATVGGYWHAAQELKAQRRAAAAPVATGGAPG